MSKLKNQLRHAQNAAIYITCAKDALRADEDPNLIIPDQFSEMTIRFFSELRGSNDAKDLSAFHRVAHHPTQIARLGDRFYRAANQGFGTIRLDTHNRMVQWPEFFAAITPLLKQDQKLCAIVNKQFVQNVLPKAVWSADGKADVIETAAGILKALGGVPEAVAGLEPEMVSEMIKAHIKMKGGRIAAAPTLDELRVAEPFRGAVAADENAAGLHVASYSKKLKNSDGWGSYWQTFVLVFDRASQSVAAHTLDLSRSQPRSEVVMENDGSCLQYKSVLEEVLLEHSYADLPGQDWVKPIAEERALALG
jgi:hypothetical protein